MKKFAIIVAGGSGQRMGASIPKQFLMLKGKTLLEHTTQAFLNAYADITIILVLPTAHLQKGMEIRQRLKAEERIQIATGGDTRFQSVKNGLEYVDHPSIVFVHDGVRCMVTTELIQRCYKQSIEKGSAIPAVVATDSIRLLEDTKSRAIDRNKVRIVQTPQTFQSKILCKAFEQEYNDAFTDEATVVEASGSEVFLIDGEYSNLKVTRPIDLIIAEKLLDDLTF